MAGEESITNLKSCHSLEPIRLSELVARDREVYLRASPLREHHSSATSLAQSIVAVHAAAWRLSIYAASQPAIAGTVAP